MVISTKEAFLKIVYEDKFMIDVLRTTKSLQLPDWWVCAGFVRSKIWDVQHGFETPSKLPDVDVIYFDRENIDEKEEVLLEEKLKARWSDVPWSVKNQARMHHVNGSPPYKSSVDAISKFPETATSLGLKLDDEDKLILVAPHGLEDALHMKVKPTPYFQDDNLIGVFKDRIAKKNWQSTWNKVEVGTRGSGTLSRLKRK